MSARNYLLEKWLGRCRAPVRTAIRNQLRDIAAVAGKSQSRVKRILLYQVDNGTRRVVVLDLGRVPS